MIDYSKFFKAYDIRGTHPDLNVDTYYFSAIGFVEKILKPQKLPMEVNLVRDGRLTSQLFYNTVAKGLSDAGAKPIKLGLGSTDMLYAACQMNDKPGIMITASHNPKQDNGMKIVKQHPQMVGLESGLDLVRDFVLESIKNDSPIPDIPESGEDLIEQNKLKEFFVEKLEKIGEIDAINKILQNNPNPMKIVVDCGNGMGGYIMSHLLPNLYHNIEFIPLFWDVDGNFPNHPADPQNYDNLKELQAKIIETQAQCGFAFDGDGDRVFFCNEKGEVVNGDFLCSIISKYMLADFDESRSEFKKAIVYPQSASRCFPNQVIESAGTAVASLQGHTFMKQKMQTFKALYGGELSGHHYFGEFGYMDSGVLAAVFIIKIMTQENIKLSQLTERLSKNYYLSDLINIRLRNNQNFEKIKQDIINQLPKDGEISHFDGLSIYYPDWKFSLRSSNTEPKLRLVIECFMQDNVESKVKLITDIIDKS